MSAATSTTFTCASCESSFDWAPVVYRGAEYCCGGCAAGGPCCCSYDGSRGQLASAGDPLPMTWAERERLALKAAQLRLELAAAIERRHIDFGTPRNEGAEALPIWEIERRQRDLLVIEDVLARAEVTAPGTRPIIGSLVTLEAEDGGSELYRLVAPGEEDHTLNRVSYDSPFGQLLGRATPGSTFAVKVVHGARRMTVVAVSFPESGSAATRVPMPA